MSEQWSESAKVYDYFTLLTKQYAARMVDVVKREIESKRFHGQIKLLDVACGTGIVPIVFLEQLGDKLNILGVDLSEQMVNIAEQKFLALNYPDISAKVMDGQALSLHNDSFHVCTNLFGLIFFPDRVKGFREMHRILKKDGVAIIGSWHYIQSLDVAKAIASHYGKPYSPDIDKAMSLADTATIIKEMTEAGFKDIKVESISIPWVINDKTQFEKMALTMPIYSYNLDKQQLAKDLPNILETVIPNYKTVLSFSLQSTANIAYGFK